MSRTTSRSPSPSFVLPWLSFAALALACQAHEDAKREPATPRCPVDDPHPPASPIDPETIPSPPPPPERPGPAPLDLGSVTVDPGAPALEVLGFDVAHERAADGGLAHLAELRFATPTAAAARLELTTLPGRGAALALTFEDRLGLSTVDGAATPPAPFVDRAPRLTVRRSHAVAPIEAHVEPLALRHTAPPDHEAFAAAALELRARLLIDPSACPGCVEALDDLGWSWLATLRTACREALAPEDHDVCTSDLWHRAPTRWW